MKRTILIGEIVIIAVLIALILMDFTGRAEDIDDPWYTGDFGGVYKQIERGCAAMIEKLGYGA